MYFLLTKLLDERGLWYDGAWSLRDQLWSKHEHEIRVCGRGDAYVVGEFVLAYLHYYIYFAYILQG